DRFTANRLLRQLEDTVEISHEALLRAWPMLRRWLDEDRAGNLVRQDIEDAATTWVRDNRSTHALFRGTRLTKARDWSATQPNHALSDNGRAFLAASVSQFKRSVRIRRVTVAFMLVLTLVASAIAVYAFQQRDEANAQRENAEFSEVLHTSSEVMRYDSTLSAQMLVAAKHYGRSNNLDSALVASQNMPLSTVLFTNFGNTGHVGFHALAYSPRTGLIAAVDGEHLYLWPTRSGPPKTVALGRSARHLVFSPDGQLLVTGHDDGTFQVWDMARPTAPTPMVLVYESQFLDRQIRNDGSIRPDMKMLYLSPTVYSKHT
ncbi:WD40 repeat domain-containing protein, partial [Kibdelosporangium lantanae]